jgi:hypothetical protein
MLWLTGVARPTARLRDHFFYYVIPPDTVRAFEDEGLVGEKHFRPSKRTKLLAYEEQLSPEGIRAVKSLSAGEITDTRIVSPQERRYILEAAAELVEYEYIEGKISKEIYASRYHSLLSERAGLGLGDLLNVRLKSNPDGAHRSARLSLSQGWFEKRTPMVLGIRPAFHDLSEDDTGHLAGAQIEFLDTLIAVEHDKVTLEKLTILSLASIAPVSHFFKPFSWRMKSGWDRDYGADRLSFVTRIGAGASVGNDQIFGYVLSEPEVRLGFNADVALGFAAGAAINWGNRMKSHIEAGHIFYLDGEDRSRIMVSQGWQWGPLTGVQCSYEGIEQDYREDRFKLGVNIYF